MADPNEKATLTTALRAFIEHRLRTGLPHNAAISTWAEDLRTVLRVLSIGSAEARQQPLGGYVYFLRQVRDGLEQEIGIIDAKLAELKKEHGVMAEPSQTELDRQVENYKRRADAGEKVSRADAIWLLNELIYERDTQRAFAKRLADFGEKAGASPWT